MSRASLVLNRLPSPLCWSLVSQRPGTERDGDAGLGKRAPGVVREFVLDVSCWGEPRFGQYGNCPAGGLWCCPLTLRSGFQCRDQQKNESGARGAWSRCARCPLRSAESAERFRASFEDLQGSSSSSLHFVSSRCSARCPWLWRALSSPGRMCPPKQTGREAELIHLIARRSSSLSQVWKRYQTSK